MRVDSDKLKERINRAKSATDGEIIYIKLKNRLSLNNEYEYYSWSSSGHAFLYLDGVFLGWFVTDKTLERLRNEGYKISLNNKRLTRNTVKERHCTTLRAAKT